MKNILKILGITQEDIAQKAKVSRPAVCAALKKKRGRGYETARILIDNARLDDASRCQIKKAVKELRDFLMEGN